MNNFIVYILVYIFEYSIYLSKDSVMGRTFIINILCTPRLKAAAQNTALAVLVHTCKCHVYCNAFTDNLHYFPTVRNIINIRMFPLLKNSFSDDSNNDVYGNDNICKCKLSKCKLSTYVETVQEVTDNVSTIISLVVIAHINAKETKLGTMS